MPLLGLLPFLWKMPQKFYISKTNEETEPHQYVIAQWLACWLATGEVLGSNPGKEEYY